MCFANLLILVSQLLKFVVFFTPLLSASKTNDSFVIVYCYVFLKIFGNVTNVSVISDMVIIFKKKPYETVLYNLADFLNQVSIKFCIILLLVIKITMLRKVFL